MVSASTDVHPPTYQIDIQLSGQVIKWEHDMINKFIDQKLIFDLNLIEMQINYG